LSGSAWLATWSEATGRVKVVVGMVDECL
jgi:hypothetical protein